MLVLIVLLLATLVAVLWSKVNQQATGLRSIGNRISLLEKKAADLEHTLAGLKNEGPPAAESAAPERVGSASPDAGTEPAEISKEESIPPPCLWRPNPHLHRLFLPSPGRNPSAGRRPLKGLP